MYSIIGILFVEEISKNTIKIHSNHFWRWSTCTYSFVTSLFRVNSFENSKGSFHRFYNHNNFIFKHGSIQYEREFLILITDWPSKKIFFERKGLIPRSDPLCPGQWWIEINFNNKWAANRTDRLLRVNSRLEIKKKEKKKEGVRSQRIRNFTENWNNFARKPNIFRKFRGQMTRNEATSVKSNVNIWRG